VTRRTNIWTADPFALVMHSWHLIPYSALPGMDTSCLLLKQIRRSLVDSLKPRLNSHRGPLDINSMVLQVVDRMRSGHDGQCPKALELTLRASVLIATPAVTKVSSAIIQMLKLKS
jgi:hypothetical protein